MGDCSKGITYLIKQCEIWEDWCMTARARHNIQSVYSGKLGHQAGCSLGLLHLKLLSQGLVSTGLYSPGLWLRVWAGRAVKPGLTRLESSTPENLRVKLCFYRDEKPCVYCFLLFLLFLFLKKYVGWSTNFFSIFYNLYNPYWPDICWLFSHAGVSSNGIWKHKEYVMYSSMCQLNCIIIQYPNQSTLRY